MQKQQKQTALDTAVEYETDFQRLLKKEITPKSDFEQMLSKEFKVKRKKLVKVDREVVREIEVDEWWCAACGNPIASCESRPGTGVHPISRRTKKEVRSFVTVEEWVDE